MESNDKILLNSYITLYDLNVIERVRRDTFHFKEFKVVISKTDVKQAFKELSNT